jgi:hypothetical protein
MDTGTLVWFDYDNVLMVVISVALGPTLSCKLFATGSGDCRARIWSYRLISEHADDENALNP